MFSAQFNPSPETPPYLRFAMMPNPVHFDDRDFARRRKDTTLTLLYWKSAEPLFFIPSTFWPPITTFLRRLVPKRWHRSEVDLTLGRPPIPAPSSRFYLFPFLKKQKTLDSCFFCANHNHSTLLPFFSLFTFLFSSPSTEQWIVT